MEKKSLFKSPFDSEKNYRLEDKFTQLISPIYLFIKSQTTACLLLFFSVLLAVALFNSPWRYLYEGMLNLPITIQMGQFNYSDTLVNWVNDILMVLFFFLIGLEIKRELLVGELRKVKLRNFVMITAVGGMSLPALIYLFFNYNNDFANGWGIPMATDTAFSIGLLALLGKRIPKNLFVILIALAIVDDFATVLVLMFMQGEALSLISFGELLVPLVALIIINLIGIRSPLPYFILGVVLWIMLTKMGMHAASIAGFTVAFCVPARPKYEPRLFSRIANHIIRQFKKSRHDKKQVLEDDEQHHLLEDLHRVSLKTTTPLQHWKDLIHTPVGLVIIPLFGLLNAGVEINLASIHEMVNAPLSLSISFGLIIGKFLGIIIFAWLALKLKIGKLPKNIHFKHIIGLGFVCGIGFTMSIFIARATFDEGSHELMLAKLSIMMTSLLSLLLATLWFRVVCKK